AIQASRHLEAIGALVRLRGIKYCYGNGDRFPRRIVATARKGGGYKSAIRVRRRRLGRRSMTTGSGARVWSVEVSRRGRVARIRTGAERVQDRGQRAKRATPANQSS